MGMEINIYRRKERSSLPSGGEAWGEVTDDVTPGKWVTL